MQMSDAQLYCRKDTIKKLCDVVFGSGRNINDFNDVPVKGLYERVGNTEHEVSDMRYLFHVNEHVMGLQNFRDEVVKPIVEASIAEAISNHVQNLRHDSSASPDEISTTVDETFQRIEPYIYSFVGNEVHRHLSEMIQRGELKIVFGNSYY